MSTGDSVRSSETMISTKFECFVAAVQFLTRVSVPGVPPMSTEVYAQALRGGVAYFPLVGGCIGVFTATCFFGFSWGLSIWIAALIAIGSEALLTGAFHEDAFADSCDALGGGWTREQTLEIMQDSRLGTYGTLGLVIFTGIRVGCFVELADRGWAWAMASIVASSMIGRLAIVGMMMTTSPITDRPTQARDVSGAQTWQSLRGGLAMALPFGVAWLWQGPILAIITLMFVTTILFGYRRYILRRVGGTTGDLLGCSAYLTQQFVLIFSSWHTC